MLMLPSTFLRRGPLALALLWTLGVSACNVPVFRYALERWEADRYEAVVFCHEPLTAQQQATLGQFEQASTGGRANLAVTKADPARGLPPALEALWKAQGNPALPWMVLHYPRQSGIEHSAWAGPMNAEQIKPLLESPVRRTVTQNLLKGDAIVWLLLESGDPQRDQAVARQLESELRHLEQTLKLPELSPLDPPVNPNLPLKIAFSTVRVSRTDPAESALVKLLLNWNPQRTAAHEPMLFPIFGRGRAIPPAVGKEIRPEAIREMATFLTGPCSCEIKDLNPGFDLLLTADWNTMAGYQEVALPMPPLVSMSQFASSAANTASVANAATIVATNPPAAFAATVHEPAEVATPGLLRRNLLVVLAVGLGVLAVTTVVLRTKAAGRAP